MDNLGFVTADEATAVSTGNSDVEKGSIQQTNGQVNLIKTNLIYNHNLTNG